MADPRIRSKFPLSDKIKLGMNFLKPKTGGIEQIKNNMPLFNFKDMYPEVDKNMALKLNVLGTGILNMDQHVLHPFVRIHIVDLNTNKYLAKSDIHDPGVTNLESVSFFKVSENQPKTAMKSAVDFILPMSTKMYDLRIKGVNFCEWNESFVINEKAANLFRPNILFLFEILEFNPLLVASDSSLLNSEKLYPVAWTYLRPLGAASIHLDKLKL